LYFNFFSDSFFITFLSDGIATSISKQILFYMFLAYFPQKGKWGLWDHQSVCLSVPPSLITFEPIGRFLWNSVRRSCHWRWPRCRTFQPRTFNHSKMADVQTSEVNAKLASVNVGPWNFVYW
jgi:hypothetical protein